MMDFELQAGSQAEAWIIGSDDDAYFILTVPCPNDTLASAPPPSPTPASLSPSPQSRHPRLRLHQNWVQSAKRSATYGAIQTLCVGAVVAASYSQANDSSKFGGGGTA